MEDGTSPIPSSPAIMEDSYRGPPSTDTAFNKLPIEASIVTLQGYYLLTSLTDEQIDCGVSRNGQGHRHVHKDLPGNLSCHQWRLPELLEDQVPGEIRLRCQHNELRVEDEVPDALKLAETGSKIQI